MTIRFFPTNGGVYQRPLSSGSQPFLANGTLNIRKNLAAHLYENFSMQDLEKNSYILLVAAKSSFFHKTVVKVRTKKVWRHTWQDLTAHRLRNAALENNFRYLQSVT
jgi:hypothetical protein